ncbi:MAG: hypothetical protein RL358_351 [Pseudomonadota bacterium]|jgi:uncharacterized repeat protein (TIGR01451 family)
MMRATLKIEFNYCTFVVRFFLCLLAPHVAAAATSAGMIITNTATVTFSIAGAAQMPYVATASGVVVDELIHPVMVCNSPNVAVNNPSLNDVLSFSLTNAGNGSEAFSLARTNAPLPLPIGNYIPVNSVLYDPLTVPPSSTGAIFLESNGVFGFQPGVDVVYVPGRNDPVVPAGKTQIIYVLSDTPTNPPVAINALGEVSLLAMSKTTTPAGVVPVVLATSAPMSLGSLGGASKFVIPKGGDLGVADAVVVTPGAAASALCSYAATGLGFVMVKSVVAVTDPLGGAVLMPGATMTYQLVATLNGVGSATNLLVLDPLPASVTYVPGSMVVAGVVQTDMADADKAQFVVASNTVSVLLGTLLAPANVVITFRAVVN